MLRLFIQIAICFVFFSSPLLAASYFMSSTTEASSAALDSRGAAQSFQNANTSTN